MPTAAEGFIIVMIVVVGLAAARLFTLGDALGRVLGLTGHEDDATDETS